MEDALDYIAVGFIVAVVGFLAVGAIVEWSDRRPRRESHRRMSRRKS